MTQTRRLTLILLLLAMGAAGHAATLNVFSGTQPDLVIGPWGSGRGWVNQTLPYRGAPSLQVGTRGFFEGAFVRQPQPIDLAPYLQRPQDTTVVIIAQTPRFVAPGTMPWMGAGPGAGTAPGMAPGPGAFPGGGVPGAGAFPAGPGAMPGMPGMPGAMPGMGMGMTPGGYAPTATSAIASLRVLLITDRGQIDTGAQRLLPFTPAGDGWLRLAVPLEQCVPSGDLSGARLLGAAVFGDAPGTLYVGHIYLKRDDPALVARIEGPGRRVVRVAEPVVLQAAAQAAGVQADYQWDFDLRTGLQLDALGPQVSTQFSVPGGYVVTLRVVDPAGQREEQLDQVMVLVEEDLEREADIVELTGADPVHLDQYLAPGRFTIVDFYSDFSPASRDLAPRLRQMAARRGDLRLVRIDVNRPEVRGTVDLESPVAEQFYLRSVPYFMIFGPDGRRMAEADPAYRMVQQLLAQ